MLRARTECSVGPFVKLQFKLNSSVQVGQGDDFVFPLSQQEQQEEQQQPPPKSTTSRHTRSLRFGMLT